MARRYIRVLHKRVRSVQPRELPLTYDEKKEGVQLIEIDDDMIMPGDAWPRVRLDPNAPEPPETRDPHAPPEVRQGRADSNTPEGQFDPPRGDYPRQPKPDPNAPRPLSERPPSQHKSGHTSTEAQTEAGQERAYDPRREIVEETQEELKNR